MSSRVIYAWKLGRLYIVFDFYGEKAGGKRGWIFARVLLQNANFIYDFLGLGMLNALVSMLP